jgi:hypothetical protein
MELDDWLEDGGPEADWAPHLLKLATRGELGRVGDLLLDLPALAQRHACVSGECTPGKRAARTKSCCADLEVGLTEAEVGRISAVLPEVAAWMRERDPRWADGAPIWQEERALTRSRKRCVFAVDGPDGLRCGLHQLEDATGRPRGALKPLPCRLFPLALVELEDGRLLTAIHRRTAALLDAPSAKVFPCLRDDPARPALADEMAGTLTELFGASVSRRVRKAVADFRGERPRPRPR